MKNLFILLLMAFGLNAGTQSNKKVMSSQEKVSYKSEIEKFYGIWTYEENGKTFTIVLKHRQNEKLNVPFLVGYHLYKDGNKVLDGDTKENTITSGTLDPNVIEKTKIRFRFRETGNDVYAKGTLEFKGNNRDLLTWNLVLTEGQMINFDGKKPDYRLHIPNNVVLKRVK